MSKKSEITIEYFEVYGIADPLRFLLHREKVDYELVIYDLEAWGKLKKEGKGGEFGGLPRVTYKGKEYGQSMAILRMFGQKYGYYDASDWKAAAKADVFLDAWFDMQEKVNSVSLGMLMGGLKKEEAEAKIDKAIELAHVPVLKIMEA